MLRVSFLAAVLGGSLWFQFAQDHSGRELWTLAGDQFDSRRAHSVLFLGNSRTYFHGMPYMVRAIADSAGDPEKYEIMTIAEPDGTFEELANEAKVKRWIGKPWDDVVMQGESRGQSSEELSQSFEQYGEKLGGTANPSRGRPWLIVNWAYDPSLYTNPDEIRPAHLEMMRSAHDELARRADLREVGVSTMWERVRNDHPGIQLTMDGNHPTVAGSYLVALAVYQKLSGRSVANISYAPAGIDKADADTIRHIVADAS